MAKQKKKPVGRPAGPYGPYIDPALRRNTYTTRLPQWLQDKLRESGVLVGQYITDLILNDTGWKPPKV